MNQPRRHVQSDIPSHCELPFWRGNVEEEDPVHCSYCGAWMDDYHDRRGSRGPARDALAALGRQVRRYLMRKFEARAWMHPRLFELTVTSVFGDLGYRAYATAYSNDGGVDVILEDGSGERIGVQVKRRRDAVEVEQIDGSSGP